VSGEEVMVEPARMLPGRGDKCKTIQRLDVP
jgi:hypothetical protein